MEKITDLINKVSFSNWILIATLIAILWYSWETRLLRKWQKKQVQVSLLNFVMDRSVNHPNLGVGMSQNLTKASRKIYELGKLDLKDFYADKTPLTRRDRIIQWIKFKINKSK